MPQFFCTISSNFKHNFFDLCAKFLLFHLFQACYTCLGLCSCLVFFWDCFLRFCANFCPWLCVCLRMYTCMGLFCALFYIVVESFQCQILTVAVPNSDCYNAIIAYRFQGLFQACGFSFSHHHNTLLPVDGGISFLPSCANYSLGHDSLSVCDHSPLVMFLLPSPFLRCQYLLWL
jgi:hypothetical protein